MQPGLWADSFWALLANIAPSAASWATLLLLTRVAGLEAAGDYAFAMAVANPLMQFAGLQLRALRATDMEERFPFRTYSTLRDGSVLGAAALGVALSPAFSSSMLAAAIAAKASEVWAGFDHGAWQQMGQLRRIAGTTILKAVLSVAASAAVVTLSLPAAWAVWAVVPIQVLVWLLLERRTAPDARPASLDSVLALARRAGPLAAATLLVAALPGVPRLVLSYFDGPRSLGVLAGFAAAAQPLAIAINALGQASASRLASLAATEDRRPFARLLIRGLIPAVAAIVVAVTSAALGKHAIARLLLGETVMAEADWLPWVVLGIGISGLAGLAGYGLTAAGLYRSQPILFSAVLVLCLVLSLAWIPSLGGWGAALAFLAASSAQALAAGFTLRRWVQKGQTQCGFSMSSGS